MSCHIVVVDDDDDVRSMITAAAREAAPAAKITERASSVRALQDIASGAVNLLITNYKMPDMDGVKLVETLRREKYAIPIIMVSGSDEAQILAEKAGIDRFVPKSAIRPALREAIWALIDVEN